MVTTLTMVGFLFIRLIHPLRLWPWSLGLLLFDDAPQDRKRVVAEQLIFANKCCAPPGFLVNLKEDLGSADDVLLDRTWNCICDAFESVPSSNIPSEYRFARMRTHQASARGPSRMFAVLCRGRLIVGRRLRAKWPRQLSSGRGWRTS